MHTWEKARAPPRQPIYLSSFIAMWGHQYLWDCAGKVFYWNSANLNTSLIEFRGYDPFLQQRKPLCSPNLSDHVVYLVRLKLSITEGGATVIGMLDGWICMLTALARRHWWLFTTFLNFKTGSNDESLLRLWDFFVGANDISTQIRWHLE